MYVPIHPKSQGRIPYNTRQLYKWEVNARQMREIGPKILIYSQKNGNSPLKQEPWVCRAGGTPTLDPMATNRFFVNIEEGLTSVSNRIINSM
jgi:hypothetical protein